MSSRESILNKVKANQPALTPVPDMTWATNGDNTNTFMTTLRSIGGNPVIVDNLGSIKESIRQTHGNVNLLAATREWQENMSSAQDSEQMEQIEVAVIDGHVAVAENGAIWIDGDSTGHRVVPFICQHLVIVIDESSIVSTMHEAYSRTDVSAPGFGVFIAGPSKTADIEQALVIGAHGARSLTVYIRKASFHSPG